MNDTITEPRRITDIIEIIASELLSALKYAKSAMQINIEINGIDHLN